jgi:pectate lyase
VDYRVTAFLVSANNCVFKGFDVVGVQVTIQTNHTQSECFRITGSNNRFEQLAMHDGMGIGWYLTAGASNLVLNCDAYNNRGLDSGSLGNIDGFGCHPSTTFPATAM